MQSTVDEQRREVAIKRIKDKEGFRIHLISYLAVNGMLVIIWALTGAGYFWPIWLIGLWGVGLVINAYVVYAARPVTEDQIQKEMKNLN
jgi:general stress protein CsbA